MHVDYFGEVPGACVQTLAGRSIGARLIHRFTVAFFAFGNESTLDRHLAALCDEQLTARAAKTMRRIPFLW